MFKHIVFTIVVFLGLILPGAALAQDDTLQHYENEEIGLSFDYPAEWVIGDKMFPAVFVANSEESMDALQVSPGQLFAMMFFDRVDEWADAVDISDGVTALEVLENYGAKWPGLASGKMLEEPHELDEFESDAAMFASSGGSHEGIVLVIIPDEQTVIHMQASTMAGEMENYREDLLALAASLHYEYVEPVVPAKPVYESEDGRLSFEYAEGWFLTERDDGVVAVSKGEEVPTPGELNEGEAVSFIALEPIADLDETLPDSDLEPGKFVAALLEERYPGISFSDYGAGTYNTELKHAFALGQYQGHFVQFSIFWVDEDTVLTLTHFKFDVSGRVGVLVDSVQYQGEPLVEKTTSVG